MSDPYGYEFGGSDFPNEITYENAAPTEAPKAQEPPNHKELSDFNLLHRLWTKAVGKEGYVKDEWRRMESIVLRAAPQAASAGPERGCINHDEIREGCPHCDIEHLARVDSATIAKLRAERDALRDAIEIFRDTRGVHQGDHVFDPTVSHCLRCEESYIVAEQELDKFISGAAQPPKEQGK